MTIHFPHDGAPGTMVYLAVASAQKTVKSACARRVALATAWGYCGSHPPVDCPDCRANLESRITALEAVRDMAGATPELVTASVASIAVFRRGLAR